MAMAERTIGRMNRSRRGRSRHRPQRPINLLAAALVVLAAACGSPPPAPSTTGEPASPSATARPASPSPAPTPALPPDPAAIAARVTSEGMRAHLVALDRIAREHGGTRATGSAGNSATADYIAGVLEDAGYAVTTDSLDVPVYVDPGGNELTVLGPGGRAFEDGRDFRALVYAAAGHVEAPVAAIGWDPHATALDGPGCSAADFAGFPRGAIVLVRPGDCWRRITVLNAQEAGAAAFVVATPWSGPDEVRRVTLLDPGGIRIPAMVASREVGDALAAAAAEGLTVRVATTGRTETRPVRSILAELPGSDPGRVVMVGAHLDSSMDGPGVVDDGTGVAAVLELARTAAGTRPRATLRFAFWAAEETGLHGSGRYVEALSERERRRIVAYLNADMLGSPNGIRGVYQEAQAAPGSDAVAAAFAADLDAHGLAWEPVDLEGGADHGPFARAGIATGGLFSGAVGVLGPAQAGRFGGTAGRPLDPCYHLACDDLANVDEERLAELAGSFARVALDLALGAGS